MKMFAVLQDSGALLAFLFAMMTMAGFGLRLVIRWLREGSLAPEPWNEEVSAGLTREDAQPLCQHCLEPHEATAYFCPHCGVPVGAIPTVSPA